MTTIDNFSDKKSKKKRTQIDLDDLIEEEEEEEEEKLKDSYIDMNKYPKKDFKILMNGELLDLVHQAGTKWGQIGERGFPELQLSVISKKLPESLQIRPRRHLLFYWLHGWYKSTLIKEFLKLTPSSRIYEQGLWYIVDTDDYTRERLRGSYDPKGGLVPPIVAEADYIVSEELNNLLGHGEKRRVMIGWLNSIMERDDEISVGLVKLFGLKEEQFDEIEQEYGIRIDKRNKTIHYKVKAILLAASHIDNSYKTLLSSGLFDRMTVINWKPTIPEFTKAFDDSWNVKQIEGKINSQIKKSNEILADVYIKEIKTPSQKYLDELRKAVKDSLHLYLKNRDSVFDVFTPRLSGDIKRSLYTHAALRVFEKDNGYDVNKTLFFDSLNLDSFDKEFCLQHYHNWIEGRLSLLKIKIEPDNVKKFILDELVDRKEVVLGDFKKEISDKFSVRDRVVIDKITELQKLGLVDRFKKKFRGSWHLKINEEE